ncbi:MAG: hypothetical protein KKG33_11735 [candidate division Zixibacteria bacterium]|nr:hypothetical protein [candidate division Zixibacteria bacterium]MBU1471340.1 hypothetical protein [candidate division Zixibacteria bacterium]MBU2626219.1 hypothetical protein [candidate division Zixibacteria bacterium]
MLEWLSDPWVVGIGCGILSGLIVTVISRTVLSRKDRREYLQKLLLANHEVIYAIRPGISEGHVPSRLFVEMLINATARRHGVDKNDLYKPTEIGEELTKEIMDSSFISASTKQSYCEQLKSFLPTESAEIDAKDKTAEPGRISDMVKYRSQMVSMTSMMLGVTAALMTVFVYLSDTQYSMLNSHSDSFKFMIPTLIGASVALIGAVIALAARSYESKRRRVGEGDSRQVDTVPRKDKGKDV